MAQDDGSVRYRIKVRNSGRRDAIDLSLKVRVYLPGRVVVKQPVSTNVNIVDIPVSTDHLFVLGHGDNRILRLELSDIDNRHLDKQLAASLRRSDDGSLEEVLKRYAGSYLLVQVLAYDSWSGARKYYRSQRHHAGDINDGYFKGLDVVARDRELKEPRNQEGDIEEQISRPARGIN
jgi:hypothetical protein